VSAKSAPVSAGRVITLPQSPLARLTSPFKQRPLTCLGDAGELVVREPTGFSEAMPEDAMPRRVLRKWWEWEYIAECAASCGCLAGEKAAIGLGVGNEPLMFYFSNYCGEVVATDLYSEDSRWSTARYAATEAIAATAPFPFRRECLAIRSSDMRALEAPDAHFDLAWSCSSIEHISSLVDLLTVFSEIARVLREGGHAVLTTEFCLTDPPYLLPGVNALDPHLLHALVDGLADAFEFVGEVDLAYNWSLPANAIRPRRTHPPGYRPNPALSSLDLFLEGQMAVAAGVSALAPIAFVLRRRRGRVPPLDSLTLDEPVLSYSRALHAWTTRQELGPALDLARNYLEGASELPPLQLYLQMFRLYAEAAAVSREVSHATLHRQICDFLDRLPPQHLQDADCLDVVGQLLLNLGDYERAAMVFELASRSPSTVADHAIILAFDHLLATSALGRGSEGVALIVDTVIDLLSYHRPSVLKSAWDIGVARSSNVTDFVWQARDEVVRRTERLALDVERELPQALTVP
jgi:SAM-dependent methyltransferase